MNAPAPKTSLNTIEADGVKIFYREAGTPDAPVLLLLHGYPTSSHMFRHLIPLLATRYRVIAPDLPGFGFTEVPAERSYVYTFDALARTVGAFVDALNLKRYAIYVFDYGAPTGFRLALAHPERVAAIISQNGNAYEEGLSNAWDPIRKYWAEPTSENRESLREFSGLEGTRWQYMHGVADPSQVEPESYMLDVALLQRPGNVDIQLDLLLNYATNVALYPDFQRYFREHQPPTLAVWGKNDPFFLPPGAEAYRRDNPNAQVILLDTGHFALETHVKEVADEILRFMEGVESASHSQPGAGSSSSSSPALRPPLPPFTLETAKQKVRLAEDAWNSRDPVRVSLAYTADSVWRNRSEFITGRPGIVAFLTRKWEKETEYRLIKEIWAVHENRIAVRFAYEWRDYSGAWFRAYGNENWEFTAEGLMARRIASINDLPIAESERKFHWPQGRRPDEHPGLTELGL